MKLSWLDIFLILFGLFIAYQLILKIFGGSWQTEALVIAFLIFNIGLTWKLNMKFERHIGWHKARNN